MSKIEWTEKTWNPIRGCRLVSPGCENCYAMRLAHRFSQPGGPYEGLTVLRKSGPKWVGKARLVLEMLDVPLKRRIPTTWFVNSMSDLFHEDVSYEDFLRILDIMDRAHAASGHVFQILTKRPMRALKYWTREGRGAERGYIHMGVSVENQSAADERLPFLGLMPVKMRWVSMEPLLKSVDVAPFLDRVDWVVVGGESGPGARSFDLDWARWIVRDCKAAGVPVFVKQLGACASDPRNGIAGASLKVPAEARDRISKRLKDRKGGDMAEWPADLRVREMPRL